MLLTAAEMAHTIVSFSSVLYMSKIDSRLEALHQAGVIYFQLRNVPGGNDYDFDYFFLTKMCICTRKTAVLNALKFFLSKFAVL